MRHVIYLLLVANIVYFGWHMFQGASRPEATRVLSSLPATAKPLVLLQEREQQAESPDDQSSNAAMTRPDPQTNVEALTGIQTLTEDEVLEEVEALIKAEPPGAGIPPTCSMMGPVKAQAELAAIEARLTELGFVSAARTNEVKEQAGYWIYLPAMTHEKSQEVKRELERNKVRDYFIGKENLISLGIYNQKKTAYRRLENIRKLGFDPMIEPRYTIHKEYWLDIAAPAGVQAQWEQISAEFPDIRLKELTCQ